MNRFTDFQEWFRLPDETKIRIFTETSRQIGLPSSSVVEKDWWVVQTLAVILPTNNLKMLMPMQLKLSN